MYIDIRHSIHSFHAIVAFKNVNLFFKTLFKSSVFFSKLPSSCFVGIHNSFTSLMKYTFLDKKNVYKKMSLKNTKILRKGSEKLQPQMSELQSKIVDFS